MRCTTERGRLPSSPSPNGPRLAAFALIRDPHGRVLLALRTDEPVWNLPGGGVEPFERPQEAVVREVAEEVHLSVRVRRLLAVYPVAAEGSGPGRASWLFDCEVTGGEPARSEEAAAVGWFDPASLPVNTWPRHRQRIADGIAMMAGDELGARAMSAPAAPTILFGGRGAERLVSVASAQRLSEELPLAQLWFWQRDGLVRLVSREALALHTDPFRTDFAPSTSSNVIGNDVDAALDRAAAEHRMIVVALHGADGEDGSLARRCERRRIAFTGSASLASAIAFDKISAKLVVGRAGVPVLPFLRVVSDRQPSDAVIARWLDEHKVLVLKPVADGSSNGLRFLADLTGWRRARQSIRTDHMIEPLARGVEVTVGVVDVGGCLLAMEPVEIRPVGAFDYAAKYLDTNTPELCPSSLDAGQVELVCRRAIQAHVGVGAFGYSRSDFIVTEAGAAVFLEINSLPGLGPTSLLPKALAHAGVGVGRFMEQQIALAVARCAVAGLQKWPRESERGD